MANGSDFDPILMANSVAQLTQSVKVLGDNMEDMTNRMVEAMERVKKSVSGVGDEMEKTADRGASAMITKFEGVNKVITGLQRKMKEIKGWAPVRAAGAAAGAAGWAGGKAMGGIKGGLGAVGLGSGAGMLSWMMKGFFRDATYAAEGQKVAQMLNQMGGVTEKYAASLGGRLRTMSVRLGREVTGDFKAGLANFAAGGFGEEDVKAKDVGVAIGGLKDNALEAAFGLDMFFEVAAGTTAKNASTLAVDMNMSLKDSVAHTQELYVATRNWGVSYGVVIGAIMQSTSALRMMGVEKNALMGTGERMASGFMQSGMSKQRAGTLAMGSLGAIGGAFANMPMGWQAHIGKDVGRKLGGENANLDSMQAIYKMSTGFGGLGKAAPGQFTAILDAVTNFATSRTGGKDEDMWMMLTQGMGFSKQVAQGIIALNKDTKGSARMSAKQREKHLAEIRKSFGKETTKTPPQLLALRKLNDTFAKIGGALLISIVGGFASMYGGILALYGAFTGESELRNEGRKIMSQWASPTRNALSAVMSGMSSVGEQFGEGVSLFDMRGGGDSRLYTKAERDRSARSRAAFSSSTALDAKVRKRAGISTKEGLLPMMKEFSAKVLSRITTELPALMAIEDDEKREAAIERFTAELQDPYETSTVGYKGSTKTTAKLRGRMKDSRGNTEMTRMIRRAVHQAVEHYYAHGEEVVLTLKAKGKGGKAGTADAPND